MCYNKNELRAMLMIAQKMNWHKPVWETLETINQMVRNQQALELDTVGECDDYEETLLSIALKDKDKILSTMYVSDYIDLVMWGVELFKEDMGMDSEALTAMFNWQACKDIILAPIDEAEDEFSRLDAEYNDADWYQFYNYSVYMGWI